jgi:hypothetical protein
METNAGNWAFLSTVLFGEVELQATTANVKMIATLACILLVCLPDCLAASLNKLN